MILGISLVVQELNKGPRLLFRYPEESSTYYHRTFKLAVDSGFPIVPSTIHKKIPPAVTSIQPILSVPEDGNIVDLDVANESAKGKLMGGNPPTYGTTSYQRSTAAIRLNQIYEQYFGLSDENFAKLFRAKNALLGKFLDFSIGDLHFISLPCTCPLASPATPSHDEAQHKEKSYAEAVTGMPPSVVNPDVQIERDLISSFNIVIATISRKAMAEIQRDFIYKCQSKCCTLPGEDPIAAAMGLRTKLTGVCNSSIKRLLMAATQSLCLQEKKCRYLTKEISRILKVIDSHRNDPHQTANSEHFTKLTEVNYFDARSASVDADDDADSNKSTANVIGVVEFGRSRRSSSNTSSHNHGNVSMTSGQLTASPGTQLDSPELLENAVSDCDRRRTHQILQPLGQSNPRLIQSNPTRFLCHTILMESNLANELKVVFHGIAGFHGVNIRFNNGKPLHLQLVCKDVKSCEDSQGLIATKARGASTSVPSVFKPPAVMPHSITKVDVVSLGAFVPDNETKNEIFHTGIPPIGASTGNASPAKLWKGGNPWYETILLLGDPETVLSVLDVLDGLGNKSGSNGGGTVPTTPSLQTPAPGGTKSPSTPLTTTSLNTRLQALIEIADPSQSIMDISFHLDEPIEEVLTMASYLQTWGLAEIIPLVYMESCYQLHPSAPLSSNSRVAKAFEALIYSFDIIAIHESFSQAPPQTTHTRKRSASYTAGGSITSNSTVSTVSPNNTNPVTAKLSADPFSFQTMDDMIEAHFAPKGLQYQAPSAPLSTIMEQSSNSTARGNSSSGIPLPRPAPLDTSSMTPVINMDHHSDIPPEFALPKILTLFDGCRRVKDVLLLLPKVLQEYILDVIVFLLRWHMLVQVNCYLVNFFGMSSTSQELLDVNHPINQVTSQAFSHGPHRKQRRDSYDETKNGSLGLYLSDSERSLEIETLVAESKVKQQSGSSNLTNNLQVSSQLLTFLKNPHTSSLTNDERHTLEKIAPFIENFSVSTKTLGEILWITKTSERELNAVMKKLPYLRTVNKFL